jgi:hypothetical protein
MANQPTSFRYPFALPADVHPGVRNALRTTFNGVKDLNDAVRKLKVQVDANKSAVTTITNNIASSSGGSPAPSPAPVFGSVNLQPNLTPGLYTLAQSDLGGLILVQSGIAFALTLNSGLVTPFFTTVYNLGAGTVTATPSLGNVNNGASVTVVTNQFSIFFFDGTNWWDVFSLLPVLPSFADDETPAGTIDGVNAVFTLAHSPNPAGSLELFKNGLVQRPAGADYTLAGSTITFVTPPAALSTLVAWYRY